MIDMHAHWRPAELIDALRARTREPHIVRNAVTSPESALT